DEPVNGLDLDGVRWIRGLLRRLADEGRTVLVSSHLLSEVEQTADRLVVVGRGRLVADTTTEELLRGLGGGRVRVRCARPDVLAAALRERGATVEPTGTAELEVQGLSAEEVGRVADSVRVPLHHLSDVQSSLEEAYLALTAGSVEFAGHDGVPAGAAR
ncbi:MAG TPA: ABC transporter ATP-binding protein, partial [Geodermatophilus sp.]|nr:ABC transporter ATP-binding protein [Geodermatophilus sp.]